VVDEAATLRITSLPSFLLGSTFHGMAALVKYQMKCGACGDAETKQCDSVDVRDVQASIAIVSERPCMPRRAFETKFQIASQR